VKIVLAPNAFKESLKASEVCDALEEGIKRVFSDAEIAKIPLADGGDGTLEALVLSTGGRFCEAEVTGPLGEPVKARFGLLGDGETAVVEMAEASGLRLLPKDKRDPKKTTTYGTGELIKHALDMGVRRIIVGIGGSATVDGGVGMAQALGFRFLDEKGDEVGWGGGELGKICRIDTASIDERIGEVEVFVASDVENPLLGDSGAARVFAPQKGAGPEDVELLERNLSHLADIIERDLGWGIGCRTCGISQSKDM